MSPGEEIRHSYSTAIAPLNKSGIHSFHRRAVAHNYFAPFIYHIILKKAVGCERFGEVEGDARIEFGQPGCASIQETPLGKTVAKAIVHIPYEYPILKPHQFKVMPDHVHLLLEVLGWSNFHLDFFIDRLKEIIAVKYSLLKGKNISPEEIFEVGYCDKPLLRGISLDGWYTYIRRNPERLAMRMQYPKFFERVRSLKIDGNEYEAYGNLYLLQNPDKMAVKISRSFGEEEKARKKTAWLENASRGTILVSPYISKEEKTVRDEAESLGASFIQITHAAFGERFKPFARDFDLCSSGRLLIISLGETRGTKLSRGICERMNALAGVIAGG